MNISTDPVIAQIEKMLAQKLITEEQAQTKIMDRIDFLNTRKVDSMEKLANALTGEGVGSNTGRSTTRPGGTTGTTGTPAVNRFLGQR